MDEISFDLGKNGGHGLSRLGSRLIAVIRWAHKILAVYVKFSNFSFGVCLGC